MDRPRTSDTLLFETTYTWVCNLKGLSVSNVVGNGDVTSVVDPRLEDDFQVNSAWKAVEIAMACVSATSTKRPTMNMVVIELKDCLAMEAACRNKNSPLMTDSVDSNDEILFSVTTTEISPLAR